LAATMVVCSSGNTSAPCFTRSSLAGTLMAARVSTALAGAMVVTVEELGAPEMWK
jgi:hypothetical protein